MATNLVTLVMQFLTPEMIGRVATALGLDRTLVQSAIGAAVPGLLAGLSGVATQPGGAQKLVEAAKQETGTLGKFADMLGGGGQSNFIERGSQLLMSLLGARDQSALVSAIGQFAGLGQGKSGSLLGMLAPIVMGTVAQQQGAGGLNASSIGNLFASQKDNIAAALSGDFGKLLAARICLTRLAVRGDLPLLRAPKQLARLPQRLVLWGTQVSAQAPRPPLRTTGSTGSSPSWR